MHASRPQTPNTDIDAKALPEPQDILVVKANQKGMVFVFGDIHGKLDALMEAYAELKEYDQLILLGDLIDKGPNSAEVLDFLIAQQKDFMAGKDTRQIYIIKGNHEYDFLLYAYYQFLQNRSTEEERNLGLMSGHLVDAGGSWTLALSEEKLTEYVKFLAPLPYILHVEGRVPFNAVHAALPFNQSTLMQRIIDKNFRLEDKEKWHAVNKREDKNELAETSNDVSSEYPIITICGHTIFGRVRTWTNHVNIDFGMYWCNSRFLLNYTMGEVAIFRTDPETSPQIVQKMIDLKHDISKHLQIQREAKLVEYYDSPQAEEEVGLFLKPYLERCCEIYAQVEEDKALQANFNELMAAVMADLSQSLNKLATLFTHECRSLRMNAFAPGGLFAQNPEHAIGPKRFEKFVDYLNDNKTTAHRARLMGLCLAEIGQDCPEFVKASNEMTEIISIINRLECPDRYEELHQVLEGAGQGLRMSK